MAERDFKFTVATLLRHFLMGRHDVQVKFSDYSDYAFLLVRDLGGKVYGKIL